MKPSPAPSSSTAGHQTDASERVDLSEIDRLVAELGSAPGSLIPLLNAVQDRYHYLPAAALKRISATTANPLARIMGVASFYPAFRLEPAGSHLVKICVGTACHVKGAPQVLAAFKRALRIPPDGHTDPELRFTVAPVACLGCCTLAPVVQIDEVTYGHVSPARVEELLADFLARPQAAPPPKRSPPRSPAGVAPEVRVGLGSCCVAGGSMAVKQAVEEEAARLDLAVRVKRVGCVGMCHRTPLLEIVDAQGQTTRYDNVDAEGARALLRRHLRPRGLLARVRGRAEQILDFALAGGRDTTGERYEAGVRDPAVQRFLCRQERVATAGCGEMDPLDAREYRSRGGFQALERVLRSPSPRQVIALVKAAGLRGRGGAGFPTGRKWELVANQPGGDKVVVMNGDEGDPGAFMDRMLMESFPLRVMEGIAIAALAVGASRARLYIRHEYALALERMRAAIELCRREGVFGSDTSGAGAGLEISIMEGAGAFVCGEETALLRSIEGERGMPRPRPPYPAERGLQGLPTLVNNVETYACVPWIVLQGPERFRGMGTDSSTGTKVFSLTGKVRYGGLIEVPMGMSIREIVEEIGGGVPPGRTFKAVQIGGPSGGCVPARLAHTPVDYERLQEVGAIMGSGGLVVLDDEDCMVDIARYFLTFTQEQSCGKCTFCRVGTTRMLEILDRLVEGRAREGDLERLAHLAAATQRSSLCGLGRTAPNPVVSTLRHFPEEYEEHLHGACPAARCRALTRYFISSDCIGCTRCSQACPAGAIAFTPYRRHSIDHQKCIRCDTCRQVCPTGAARKRG